MEKHKGKSQDSTYMLRGRLILRGVVLFVLGMILVRILSFTAIVILDMLFPYEFNFVIFWDYFGIPAGYQIGWIALIPLILIASPLFYGFYRLARNLDKLIRQNKLMKQEHRRLDRIVTDNALQRLSDEQDSEAVFQIKNDPVIGESSSANL